ncbi:hypothetical protein [Mangrovibacterium lignilyticum]|uniref:hypothetical protein n=1 Tax=Mangrovibacterium lignilyticum TaxID=2668052 RepID=UPI0013D82D92|nr:hypothetical protein [Mangrovibacterium lignilyticum]
MFFVGLAGSMIPYILLMGVMLVFTLGANTEVLKKLSASKEPVKTIVLETATSTSTDNTSISFHYSEYKFPDKLAEELNSEASIADQIELPDKIEIRGNELYPPLRPHYHSNYCTRYFGLSPPDLA